MICFKKWKQFTGFLVVVILVITIGYSNCQGQLSAVQNGKRSLPECPHSSHYYTEPTEKSKTATNNPSMTVPKSHLEDPTTSIISQLQIIQNLKCDERDTEIRTVSLGNEQEHVQPLGKSIQDVVSGSSDAYPFSHFTSSGYFYDNISNTYYQPAGDYCISSYSKENITVKICPVSDQCNTSSLTPYTWCVPKCCAIDEVFLLEESRCEKISQSDGNSKWVPLIFESPENPHHKIEEASKYILFQITTIAENCSVVLFDNATTTSRSFRWSHASSAAFGNKTYSKDNIRLAAPSKLKNGLIRPLYFHADSRKWKFVENLVDFCVDRFHIDGADPTTKDEIQDDFILVTCSESELPQEEAAAGGNLWVYSFIGMFGGVVGAVFSLATIVIYGLIWDKLNLPGLTILSFNAAQFGNYVCIGVWKPILRFHIKSFLDSHTFEWLCYGTAILSHYFLFAIYLSITVLNVDLWLTLKSSNVKGESKQWKKFGLYSLAIWVLAFIIVAAFVVVDCVYKDPTTEVPVPGYGTDCYVSLYFFGQYVSTPLMIVFAINVILIGLTTKVFIDMRRQRSTVLSGAISKANIYYVKLLGKLFAIMGVGWNAISLLFFLLWAYNDRNVPWALEIIHYIVYLLTPIYLFFMFCINNRVINQLRDKHPGCAKILDSLRTLPKMGKKKSDGNDG